MTRDLQPRCTRVGGHVCWLARFIEARTDLTRTPAEATKCAALEVRRAQRGALKVLQLDSTKLHECALEGNHGREQEQHP